MLLHQGPSELKGGGQDRELNDIFLNIDYSCCLIRFSDYTL
jgi:hypothetical protein